MTKQQKEAWKNRARYINIRVNKKGTKVAYEWIGHMTRWARIKLDEAELLISAGKAKKVEKSMFSVS